jgi:branched-chain amino acid transport system permease protein
MQELLKNRNFWLKVILVLVIAFGAGIPLFFPVYYLYVLETIYIGAIIAIGYNICMGNAGQISLASAGFFAIGAYGTGILMRAPFDLSFWIAWPIAILIATGLGWLTGLPALRVGGHFLALVTLGLVQSLWLILVNWEKVTGGSGGIRVPAPTLAGVRFSTGSNSTYILCFVVLLLLLLCAHNIMSSRVGRTFNAIRLNEPAAEASGINLTIYKTTAFAIHAFYAAVAGGLNAVIIGYLDPYEYSIWASINHLIYIVVGGMGSLAGSIIGPVVIVALLELLRFLKETKLLLYGVLLLGFLIFMPQGIVGGLKQLGALVLKYIRRSEGTV